MHPNPSFRAGDDTRVEMLVRETSFAMIFLTTPDGPRVAHAPIFARGSLAQGDYRLRFHLARGNALSRQLDGAEALVVVNGPDAYISARWYSDSDQVPTWNYAAAELEGKVRKLPESDLPQLLEELTERHEAQVIGGVPWTMDKLSPAKKGGLIRAITGFEMQVHCHRETFKLSQNKDQAERGRLMRGLEQQGDMRMANYMRQIGQ